MKTLVAKQMLKEIKALPLAIAARVSDPNALRTIPRDLVEALRAIGFFRMFVPRSYGGPDATCRRR